MVSFFSFSFKMHIQFSFSFILVPFCLLYYLLSDLILISILLYFVASHHYLRSSLITNRCVI
jgi:hypothetical protein